MTEANHQQKNSKSSSFGKLMIMLAAYSLSGCAHDVSVAYDCSPSGATLYEEGVGRLGRCPMTVKYSSADSAVKGDQLYVKRVDAVWPSGVSLLKNADVMDIPPDSSLSVMLVRPADSKGYQKDMEVSEAYDAHLHEREIRYVVSNNQDRDLFEALDHGASCAWDSLIQAAYAECP